MGGQGWIAWSYFIELAKANDSSVSGEFSSAVRGPYLKIGMKYLDVVIVGTTVLKKDVDLVNNSGGELHVELVSGELGECFCWCVREGVKHILNLS